MSNRNRLWFGAAAAFVGAGLLLLIPMDRSATYSWSTMRPLGPDPFAFTVTLDTGAGTITSDLPVPQQDGADLDGLEFVIHGTSGSGRVDIVARDPSGRVLIDEIVGPDQPFSYPPDVDATGYVRVTADYPEAVPEPGGRVIFVLSAANPAGSYDPVTIFDVGVEPYTMESMDPLDSGRSDSCARLELPLVLYHEGVMRCTYTVEILGTAGDESLSVPFVNTSAGHWATYDPVVVAVGTADLAFPQSPSIVIVDPGDPDPIRPVRGTVVTDEPGAYSIAVAAPQGSAGFEMGVSATRDINRVLFAQVTPSRELGFGFLAAALVALALGLGRWPWVRRFSGVPLLAVGLAVPLALGGDAMDHHWYWNEWSHLIWLVCLAAAFAGASLLAMRDASKPTGGGGGSTGLAPAVARWLGFGLAFVVAALTAMTSASYDGGFFGGDFAGSYNGDYMLMGIHVMLFRIAVPLVAIAGVIAGLTPLPTVKTPPPPRPGGSADRSEFEALGRVMSGTGTDR